MRCIQPLAYLWVYQNGNGSVFPRLRKTSKKRKSFTVMVSSVFFVVFGSVPSIKEGKIMVRVPMERFEQFKAVWAALGLPNNIGTGYFYYAPEGATSGKYLLRVWGAKYHSVTEMCYALLDSVHNLFYDESESGERMYTLVNKAHSSLCAIAERPQYDKEKKNIEGWL